MNFKLLIIILNYVIIIKTEIITYDAPNSIVQCTAKIFKTLKGKRILIISKIDENLNDFNSKKYLNSVIIHTKDTLNKINVIGSFNVFIIFIKTINQFDQLIRNLSKTKIWNSRGKFLVGYFGNEDIGAIFNTSWSTFIYNINVVNHNNQETHIYTFFPYNKVCGKYYGYELLASCKKELNNYFPNKIPLKLHGCELNVMALVVPPYVIDLTKPREEPGQAGIEITLVHNIAKRINNSLNFIPNPYTHWGNRDKDGNVSMMYKSLQTRKVEIIFGYMFANDSYTSDFDISFSYLSEESIWFFPIAPQLPQWQNLTNIFQPELWLAIFVMFLINGIAWYFIGRNDETSDDSNDLVICIMHSMYLLLQGSVACPRTWKIRLIFLIWLMTCLLIFTAHQSQLISILTSTLYQHQMKTLEELVESKWDFGFYPVGEDAYQEKTPLNMAILKRYTPCPLTHECLNRTAIKRDFAVIKSRRQVLYLMPRYYTFPNGRPMLYDTDIVCLKTNQIFYMNQGYPLLERINNLLMLMQANGLIYKWDKDTRFCVLKLESDKEAEPLTLKHLQGAFFVLFLGTLSATVTFVCEFIFGKRNQNKKTISLPENWHITKLSDFS